MDISQPTEGEEIVSEYRSLGLALNRHPLALLRHKLAGLRFVPADVLATYSTRQIARGCGIVTRTAAPEHG